MAKNRTFDDLTEKQQQAAAEHFAKIYKRDNLEEALGFVKRVEKAETDLLQWARAHKPLVDALGKVPEEHKEKVKETLKFLKIDADDLFSRSERIKTFLLSAIRGL